MTMTLPLLFVDDEIGTVKPHIRLLQDRQFEIDTRTDADRAFEYFDIMKSAIGSKCRLIVLDMKMRLPQKPENVAKLRAGQRNADLTGAYLLESFRHWNTTTPIILLSHLKQETVVAAAWAAYLGCNHKSDVTSLEAQLRELEARFNVKICLKQSTSPLELLEIIQNLLS